MLLLVNFQVFTQIWFLAKRNSYVTQYNTWFLKSSIPLYVQLFQKYLWMRQLEVICTYSSSIISAIQCWKPGTRFKSHFTTISNTPPPPPVHAHRKKTDLVEALHHHVRHVLIKHGGWYDDLIEGFVVPPQSWIGWLLLATATERERASLSIMVDDDVKTHEHCLPQYPSLTFKYMWKYKPNYHCT